MSQPAVGRKGVCDEDGQEDQEFKKKKLTDYFAVKPSKLQLQQLPSLPKRGRGRPPKPLSLDSTSPTKKLKENNELTEKYGRPSKYFDQSDSALAAARDEAVDYFIRTGKSVQEPDSNHLSTNNNSRPWKEEATGGGRKKQPEEQRKY